MTTAISQATPAQARTLDRMRESFMSGVLDQMIALDDSSLVAGLPEKMARHLLAMAAASPDHLRPALARAAQHRRAMGPRGPRNQPTQCYFIQRGNDGPIKIGAASDPASRLAVLQTACPERLRLLAVIPGDLATESALHHRFDVHRLAGEWFTPSQAILDYIRPANS